MMTNQELEEALEALAMIVDSEVTNTANLAIGATTMALAMLGYKAKIEKLEADLEKALARIEALENGTQESTIEEANS